MWRAARRLQLGDYDPHDIHHMLMSALSEPMRRTAIDGESFDEALFRTRLAGLPGSWEAARPT